MKINTAYLILNTDKKVTENSNKVRGYIGNKFKDYPLLHNHYNNENFLYSYPLIQYQVLEGQVSILGIEEGVKTLKDISSEISELKMDKYYKVNEKIIHEKEFDVGTSREEHHYKFLSPWLALNTKNYHKYNQINVWKDKKLFLNNILVGNILSMSKSLGIIVNREIYTKTHLESVHAQYKSIAMQGFLGEFKVKFKIPDFFGLGKGVSHGFGTVKEIIHGKE
ncbi:MAG: hypothetical protein LBU74_08120 [Methanobacteriaceae archaeon]|jgi:hypothetical protein|nr:hypothetical protein [Candidatus Methanorudis spinitermitis]